MFPKYALATHRGHTLLAFPRGASPLVVDCGAHKGEFATSIAATCDARCHSIEASPRLFADMRLPEGTKGYNFAVAGKDGMLDFKFSDNPEASHLVDDAAAGPATGAATGDVVSIPARNLSTFLDEIGEFPVDLLKLDIEGAEIAALSAISDDQMRKIKQITVEFHDFCGYVTAAEVDAAIARFRRLGFHVFNFALRTRGDVLIVNPSWYPMSLFERTWVRSVERLRRRLGSRPLP